MGKSLIGGSGSAVVLESMVMNIPVDECTSCVSSMVAAVDESDDGRIVSCKCAPPEDDEIDPPVVTSPESTGAHVTVEEEGEEDEYEG